MGRISENVTEFINEAGQAPPHNSECESVLLSAILQNNSLINRISPVLKPEDFFVSLYREWYTGMVALSEENSSISPTLVANKIGRPDEYKAIEGLLNDCKDPNTFEDYLKVVVDKSLHRRMSRIMQKGYLAHYNEQGTPDELFEATTAEMFKIFSTKDNRGFRNVGEVGLIVLEKIEALGSSGHGLSGLNTGFG